MRITHACSVLATAAYVIPATETAASRWRRGSARPAPLHGLFGGGAKEDVAAGLATLGATTVAWAAGKLPFGDVDSVIARVGRLQVGMWLAAHSAAHSRAAAAAAPAAPSLSFRRFYWNF